MSTKWKSSFLLSSHREAVLVPKPLSGANGGVLGAGVHASANTKHAFIFTRVAAQQRVGQGALARSSGTDYDHMG